MKQIVLLITLMVSVGMTHAQLTWHPQNSGTNVVLFDVDFVDHLQGWVCGNAGTILYTDDGGENWLEQNAPANNTYYGIAFPTQQTGYACGFGGKIIYTVDGGISWNAQESNTDTYLFDIFFTDENTGWIVGGDNGTFPSLIPYRIILHTSNGGSTWNIQFDASDAAPLRSVFFVDENVGYAVSEDGDILNTSDGGNNWDRQADFSSNELRSVFFLDADHGWVVGEYLGLPHETVILITDDGGENWTEHYFYEGFSASDVHFLDEYNGWMVGGPTLPIHYTHDGGYTWAPDDPGVFEFLYCIDFVDESTAWAAGNSGSIISSAIPVGEAQHINLPSISVYPNPVRSFINIRKDVSSSWDPDLYLINAIGQVIFSASKIFPSGTSEFSIDSRSFDEGIYLLIMEDHEARKVEKIMIFH